MLPCRTSGRGSEIGPLGAVLGVFSLIGGDGAAAPFPAVAPSRLARSFSRSTYAGKTTPPLRTTLRVRTNNRASTKPGDLDTEHSDPRIVTRDRHGRSQCRGKLLV